MVIKLISSLRLANGFVSSEFVSCSITIEEVFYFLEGQAVIQIAEETHPVLSGDCVIIPMQTVHVLTNTGTTEMKFIITASGEVYPCIMARAFPVGNVLEQDIATILVRDVMQATTATLLTAFTARSAKLLAQLTMTIRWSAIPKFSPSAHQIVALRL